MVVPSASVFKGIHWLWSVRFAVSWLPGFEACHLHPEICWQMVVMVSNHSSFLKVSGIRNCLRRRWAICYLYLNNSSVTFAQWRYQVLQSPKLFVFVSQKFQILTLKISEIISGFFGNVKKRKPFFLQILTWQSVRVLWPCEGFVVIIWARLWPE